MDMGRNDRWRQPGKLWWLLPLFLYLAVNAVFIQSHESWRDEAQAWQIARQTNLVELFAQLKYEGHPCLWYLVLMPFAKLGYPFSGLGFLSLFFMAAAAGLVLAKSPFSFPVKFLIVFGSPFLYYYPVIARSYCLIPPLLAVLALLYPFRREKPLPYGAVLGFLTQTHVLAAALSFSLSAAWLLETVSAWRRGRRQGTAGPKAADLAGLSISLGSGLFLVWELAGSLGSNASVRLRVSPSLLANLRQAGEALWKAMQEFLRMEFGGAAALFLMLLIAAGLAVLFLHGPRETLAVAGAFLIQILIFAYVYPPGIQSSMILVHECIFLLWIILQKDAHGVEEEQRGREKHFPGAGFQAGLAVLLLVSLWNCGPDIGKDLKLPYSSSKGMAACIRQNVPEDAPLIAAGDLFTTGLAAYLPEREIWNPAGERPVGFSVWDERRKETISYEEMLRRVRKKYPRAEGMYLICGENSQVPGWREHTGEMEEIFRLDFCIADEGAILYYAELP